METYLNYSKILPPTKKKGGGGNGKIKHPCRDVSGPVEGAIYLVE